MNSKYAKYSTEQLEVILTHLTDPDDRELVKKELSQRYYQHYLSIVNTPGDQLPPVAEVSLEAAGQEDDEAGVEEIPATDELAAIPEVGPITLTSPAGPAAAPDPADKPADTPPKKKYCFIATAAYGSSLAPEVVLLQKYRDEYLTGNPLGETFIRAYYRFSPPCARQISGSHGLRLLARRLLTPLIFLIKKITDNPGRR